MTDNRRADRIAGATLIAASVGIVFAMAHHPTRLGDAANIMRVHVMLDLLAVAAAYGLFHMALRRGMGRPAVWRALSSMRWRLSRTWGRRW